MPLESEAAFKGWIMLSKRALLRMQKKNIYCLAIEAKGEASSLRPLCMLFIQAIFDGVSHLIEQNC